MPDPIDSEADDLPSPISISVTLRMVTTNGHRVKFEADAETREKIADLFDLIVLDSFVAKATLVPWRRDGVQLDGEIIARLSQACIVSLEPVSDQIEQSFRLRLVREGSKLARQLTTLDEEAPVTLDDDDIPDPFSGETIEVGAIFLEQLALALNPYPRVEGKEFADSAFAETDQPAQRENPFAALEALKKP